jgi:apolipoprotein N-acyltransferase
MSLQIPVEYEVLVPLLISIFFTLLYESDNREMLWSGFTAWACWLITAFTWLISSAYPVISLIFFVPFIVYLLRTLIGTFKPLEDHMGRRLAGEDD